MGRRVHLSAHFKNMKCTRNKEKWIFNIVLTLFSLYNLLILQLPEGNSMAKELFLIVIAPIALIISIVVCKFEIYFRKLDILVFAFLVFFPLLTFFLNTPNTHYLVVTSSLFFLFFTLRILTKRINSQNYILNILFHYSNLNLFIQILVCLSQYFQKKDICGTFSNSGPLAIYVSSLVIFNISVLIISYKKKTIFICAYCLVLFFLFLETKSRSAFTGFFCGAIALSLFYFKNRISIKKVKNSILVITLIFISFLFYFSAHFKLGSTYGRILIYKVSSQMAKENFLFGVGMGNFSVNYMKYQSKVLSTDKYFNSSFGNFSGEIRYPFNDYLLILTEQGVFSLACFFLIVIYLVMYIIDKDHRNKRKMPYVIALICILTSGITSYPLSVIPISITFWIMLAVIISKGENESGDEYKVQKLLNFIFIIIISINIHYAVLYTSGMISFLKITHGNDHVSKLPLLYKSLKFNYSYLCIVGDYYYNDKRYEKASNYYSLATKLSPSKDIKYSLGECYQKLGKYASAEKQFLEVDRMIPHLIKPNYLLAILYYKSKQHSKFLEQALIVKASMPKINSLEAEVMKKQVDKLFDSYK